MLGGGVNDIWQYIPAAQALVMYVSFIIELQ